MPSQLGARTRAVTVIAGLVPHTFSPTSRSNLYFTIANLKTLVVGHNLRDLAYTTIIGHAQPKHPAAKMTGNDSDI